MDTPAGLARRLAEPLAHDAGPNGTVLDPACGDGALLAAAGRAWPGLRLVGLERDPARAERARARLGTRVEIRTADALSTRWPAGAHVLANPPWVSFSGRQARATDRPAATRGWPSLHGAFVERIVEHLARHRTSAALLLPASVAELDGYAPLRARVDEATLVTELEELGEHAFPGVVEPAILVRLAARAEPAPPGSGSPATWSRAAHEDLDLRASLRPFPRLPPKTFADPGVHTGNASRELVRRPAGDLPGVREGRSLHAFRLDAPTAGLVTTLARTPDRRFRIAARDRYASFPVLLRQTADRPLAALHDPPTYFRNSLLAAGPVEGLDPAFVVAVLNGPVAAAWHRASFRDARQKRFPQVKVSHLASQPFPIARRDDAPELHDRLASLARELARRSGDRHEDDPELARLVLSAFELDGPIAERVVRRARGPAATG